MLGTRGDTHVTGPELEYRLGLPSTWAYFSLRSGSTTTAEPDLSGHTESSPSTGTPVTPPAPSPAPAPTPATPQGGSEGPAAHRLRAPAAQAPASSPPAASHRRRAGPSQPAVMWL